MEKILRIGLNTLNLDSLVRDKNAKLGEEFDGVDTISHPELDSYLESRAPKLVIVSLASQSDLKTLFRLRTINAAIVAINESKEEDLFAKGLESGADVVLEPNVSIRGLEMQCQVLLQHYKFQCQSKAEISRLTKQVNQHEIQKDFFAKVNTEIQDFISLAIVIVRGDKIVRSNKKFDDLTDSSWRVSNTSIKAFLPDWNNLKLLAKEDNSLCLSTLSSFNISSKRHLECLVKLKLINQDEYVVQIINNQSNEIDGSLREVILNIHELSNNASSYEELSAETWNELKKITTADSIYIGFYEPVEHYLDLVYQKGINLPHHVDASIKPLSELIKKRTVRQFGPFEIAVLQEENPLLFCDNECYWFGIPLINNNRLLGIVILTKESSKGPFTDIETGDILLITSALSSILESKQSNSELNKALIKAQEADKLKENFLSNISHEIRTPLNSIIGFSSMLYDELPTEEKIEYVNLIIDGGQNLLKIIDNIVDIAKIQSGDLHINKMDVDLIDLLDGLKDRFSTAPEVSNNEVNLVFEVPKELQHIYLKTDPFRLSQILENLISNALKFTEHGEIKYGIRINEEESITVFVSDSGIGIPEHELDKIFDRFVQLETGHTREYGGNGLGLSITKNLVELLNGKISVQSQLGKGTCFNIKLPVEKQKFVKHQGRRSVYHWSDKKMLLVDDVPTNLEFLEILLSRTKAKTTLANNGKHAIDILDRDADFDIVIMDLKMPIMDGYQATRIIKNKYPHIKVIIQTAFIETADKKRAFESGCDDYIEKPIKANELLSLISRHI